MFKPTVFILCIFSVKCSTEGFVGFQAFPSELRMTQGEIYSSEIDTNTCCLVCANNDTCTSVNYNKGSKTCEINTLKMKSREYRIQPDQGWTLYEKLPCGIGYMSGARCRHIQNSFQYDDVTDHEEALNFCEILGDNLATLDNEQDKVDLESDAALADMYINAYIWLGTSTQSTCSCFRREFADIELRSCDMNAAIVCERPG